MDPVVHLTTSEPRDDGDFFGEIAVSQKSRHCEERSDAAIHKSNTDSTPRLDRHAIAHDDSGFLNNCGGALSPVILRRAQRRSEDPFSFMLILCGLIGHRLNTQRSMDPVFHLTASEPRDDGIVRGNRGIAKTASLRGAKRRRNP